MGEAELANTITQAQSGDAEAWGELYRRYAPAIFRFCRRALPTREDAEDATMEVFMKVRAKLNQYDPKRPFTSWLYAVAANHCWDSLRRRRVRQDLETGDVSELPLEQPDTDQLSRLIEQHTSQQLRDALDDLPPRARLVLVLRYYAEMSYDDIAEATGLRRTFVGVVLLRARHQLRETLVKRGAIGISAGGNA
jgi:RNA polymerase sigma-70 factor, ECF subfamily